MDFSNIVTPDKYEETYSYGAYKFGGYANADGIFSKQVAEKYHYESNIREESEFMAAAEENEPVPTVQNQNTTASADEAGNETAANSNTSETGTKETKTYTCVFHAVKSDGINIRALPQHDSALVAGVSKAANLYYYGETGQGYGSDGQIHTWYYVTTDSGLAGWVRSDLVY